MMEDEVRQYAERPDPSETRKTFIAIHAVEAFLCLPSP